MIPETIDIFIPTRGRIDVQKAWDSLPEKWQKRTTLVCPEDEVEAHRERGRNVVARPGGLATVSKVRDYIAFSLSGEVCVMFDDDLRFFRRIEGSTKLRLAEDEDFDFMFNSLVSPLMPPEELAMVGISYRGGNNHLPLPYIHNTKIHGAYAFRPSVLSKEGIRFGDMPLMEDYHVVLSLLERGYPNKSLSEMCWNQFTNTPGGCSLYRTMDLQTQAAYKLYELHPEFVKVVVKKPKFAWGAQERHDVNMRWKKAWMKGQWRRELRERRIKAVEAFSNA